MDTRDRKATITDLRKRGKDKEDKWGQIGEHQRRGGLTWADAGAEDLQAAVAAATEDGAALLLSKTSDGGALCVQVWNGQGRHKLFPATVAELNEALDLITAIAEGRETP